MKKIVLELLTNRFGIVLAAINLCYLVSQKFVHYAFLNGLFCESLYYRQNIFFRMKEHFSEIMFDINLPAVLAYSVQEKLIQTVFPDFCFFTNAKFQIVFLIFFITMQWLLIGWTAKTIARAVRPNQN